MILRPVRGNLCRLSECDRDLSLTDMLDLNLSMDEHDDDTP